MTTAEFTKRFPIDTRVRVDTLLGAVDGVVVGHLQHDRTPLALVRCGCGCDMILGEYYASDLTLQ